MASALVTLLKLNIPGVLQVIAKYNEQVGRSYVYPSQIIVAPGVSDLTVSGGTSKKNTAVKLKILSTGTINTFEYNRTSLNILSSISPPKITVPSVASLEALLNYLNNLWGTAILPEDIDPASFVPPTITPGDVGVIALRLAANVNSYNYIGAIDLYLELGSLQLSDILPNLNLGGFDYVVN